MRTLRSRYWSTGRGRLLWIRESEVFRHRADIRRSRRFSKPTKSTILQPKKHPRVWKNAEKIITYFSLIFCDSVYVKSFHGMSKSVIFFKSTQVVVISVYCFPLTNQSFLIRKFCSCCKLQFFFYIILCLVNVLWETSWSIFNFSNSIFKFCKIKFE